MTLPPEERLARLLTESGLIEHPTEEEKQRYQPALPEVLEELGRKVAGGGKPLLQIIIRNGGKVLISAFQLIPSRHLLLSLPMMTSCRGGSGGFGRG